MTHELGHALGLSHTHTPDCDNKDECKQNDSDKTISYMSYKNSWPMNYAAEIFSELDIYKKLHLTKYPISKSISKRIFSIPMHPYMTKKELDKVIDLIIEFLSK